MDLVNKYRPTKLSQIIGQDEAVAILRGVLKNRDELNAVTLFCGPHSTGKTTLAWMLALYANCSEPAEDGEACRKCSSCKNIIDAIKNGNNGRSVIEKPVSERGIDAVRNLESQAAYRCQDRYRWFILDEVHNLTKPAFDAALRLLEKPPKQGRFILCTTEPHLLPRTIMSRNFVFNLKKIGPKTTAKKLLLPVCKKEGLEVEKKHLLHISEQTDGHPRDALNLLSQWAAALEGGMKPADAPKVIGKLPAASTHQAIEKYVKGILTKKAGACFYALQYADSPVYFIDRTIVLLREVLYRWATNNKLADPKLDYTVTEVMPKVDNPPIRELSNALDVLLDAQEKINRFLCNSKAVLDVATLKAIDEMRG